MTAPGNDADYHRADSKLMSEILGGLRRLGAIDWPSAAQRKLFHENAATIYRL
jgi:hypothetical protein